MSHSGSFQSNRVVESVVKGIDKFDGVSTLQRPGSAWPCNHGGTTERHRPQYFHQNAATALFVFHFEFDTERRQILSARGAKTRTRATALITIHNSVGSSPIQSVKAWHSIHLAFECVNECTDVLH